LPLDALRLSWSLEATASAVLEHDRVVALTPAATAAGIVPGMRRGGVAAIAPHARLLERDRAAEQATLDGAALALLRYTPEVAHGPGDTLLLSVGASLRVFGGARALGRQAAATAHTLGLQASLGMAPTAGGAWLLARRPPGRQRRILRLARLASLLDTLPCALLVHAQAHLEWLAGIGCRNLGQLRGLPRAGLQRRCGPGLLAELDTAYGHRPTAHAWFVPPLRFRRRFEPLERLEHTDEVLAVARLLVEQMSGWLVARQRAVPRLTLALEHERGRHARPPTCLELTLAEPAWQPAHLIGLLRERLGRMTLAAPVVAVVLEALETVAQPAPNTTLFPEPGNAAADRARLLDLLTARLGHEQVLRPCPAADHRPEVANRWVGAQARTPPPAPLPMPLERPFWLLDPPLALRVRLNRPVHGTPLTLVRGPERIESGWWDGAPAARDYFVAEDAHATRYWVYRERDANDARWFLHGLYA
jgi:protein ImuB